MEKAAKRSWKLAHLFSTAAVEAELLAALAAARETPEWGELRRVRILKALTDAKHEVTDDVDDAGEYADPVAAADAVQLHDLLLQLALPVLPAWRT